MHQCRLVQDWLNRCSRRSVWAFKTSLHHPWLRKTCCHDFHSASSPSPGWTVLSSPVAPQEAEGPHSLYLCLAPAEMHHQKGPQSFQVADYATCPAPPPPLHSSPCPPISGVRVKVKVRACGPRASLENHSFSLSIWHASNDYFHSFINNIYFKQ